MINENIRRRVECCFQIFSYIDKYAIQERFQKIRVKLNFSKTRCKRTTLEKHFFINYYIKNRIYFIKIFLFKRSCIAALLAKKDKIKTYINIYVDSSKIN